MSSLITASTSISHDGASRISDEGGSIESDEAVVTELLAHTVASHHGNVVGLIIIVLNSPYSRVALHRASPVAAAVDATVLRFSTNGGGIH